MVDNLSLLVPCDVLDALKKNATEDDVIALIADKLSAEKADSAHKLYTLYQNILRED